MEWSEFWEMLLRDRKLQQKVEDMNVVDCAKGHSQNTEQICHQIYDDYGKWKDYCEDVKKKIWDIIEQFPGVHLHTKRVKSVESLIGKVISKRHEWLGDDEHKYAKINVENYKDVITDLIGLRVIINYRGKWLDIHREILEAFPMDEDRKYEKDKPLEHIEGRKFQAEIPKVYYAEGDSIEPYKEQGLDVKRHKKGYRSIHYTVSFCKTYIEIQVRTIYDEAWSDCDHNYVYKKDNNKSHTALEKMSDILAKLTRLSNDLGDEMRDVYETEAVVVRPKGGWETSDAIVKEVDSFILRLEEIEGEMKDFREKITV